MFGYVKQSALDAEKIRSDELSQKLKEEEERAGILQKELKISESRYLELISSKKYNNFKKLNDLENKFRALKEQIESESALVEKFKKDEIERAKEEIDKESKKLKDDLRAVESEVSNQTNLLEEVKYKIKCEKRLLSRIKSEIDVQDELSTVQPISQNLSGVNSIVIKEKINANKERQKSHIKSGKAWKYTGRYYLDNSLSAGKAQQKRLGKFLLTAFNAETDNIISMARKGNFPEIHKKIEKWFEKINKLGVDHHIVIERSYLKLRLEELRYVVEFHLQREFEKEEERYINESIREEKRVQKEIEKFVKAREKEEDEYRFAINQAKIELEKVSDAEVVRLKSLIEELKVKLERSEKERERAISLAQLTRSGHVYIISNEGSFGRGVYKIGMTRRLDPLDRVKELGGASVPFYFNVHGVIHSEDAPGLERELHRRFDDNRVNQENYRREFFRVPIEDIERAISEIHGPVTLGRIDSDRSEEKDGFLDEDQ